MPKKKEDSAVPPAKPVAPVDILKYKIAVSGAAETTIFTDEKEQLAVLKKIYRIGERVAQAGMVLVTGATTGAPYWAARGAKEAGGMVLGISPALTLYEHTHKYKLPTDYHDIIIFTGLGYAGRNLFVMRGADAVITVSGREGTLNEFTDAFEDEKIQGVLSHSGGTTDLLPQILEQAHRGMGRVVFEADPDILVDKVIALLQRDPASSHALAL